MLYIQGTVQAPPPYLLIPNPSASALGGGKVWVLPATRITTMLIIFCGLGVGNMLGVGWYRVVGGAGGAVRAT